MKIVIVGSGLTGAFLALGLAKNGFDVEVYDLRGDPRQDDLSQGKSINLALSRRGITSLKKYGVSESEISALGIPMHSRIVHKLDGQTEYQTYSINRKKDDFLYSVGRQHMNNLLVNKAEAAGVSFFFRMKCLSVEHKKRIVHLHDLSAKEDRDATGDVIVGADGAFSKVRSTFSNETKFDYSQSFLDHSYKELCIPADSNQDFRLDPDGLHIWARKEFMMIALPNLDRSFTCTLFMPTAEFARIQSGEDASAFFAEHFPDARPLIPNLWDQYSTNPTGSLLTIRCNPFHCHNTVLIGDAAHAVVPFFGQGMNCGMEDVPVLVHHLSNYFATNSGTISYESLESTLALFTASRKPNVDEIANMSLANYLEMRSHVMDFSYTIRRWLDWSLHSIFGSLWVPRYDLVSFSNIPYQDVVKQVERQNRILSSVFHWAVVAPLKIGLPFTAGFLFAKRWAA